MNTSRKIFQYLQGLFAIWVIYFVWISTSMLVILFIGAPVLVYLFHGQLAFPPSLDMMYKTIKFTVFASIFSGTVVWIKEVVFESEDKEV